MTTKPRFFAAALLSAIVLTTGLSSLTAGGCAITDPTPPQDVPAPLVVDGPLVGTVHATGWQIYVCVPDATGTLAWRFKAPEATFNGDIKGKHYAGPKWAAIDGSIVAATKVAEHPAPINAIPWLLLKATTHEGNGKFSNVTYIQRIHTTGGRAPAVGAARPGDEVRVPYTADYVFYGPGAVIEAK